jgi:pyrroline-5-carboxylate reductase
MTHRSAGREMAELVQRRLGPRGPRSERSIAEKAGHEHAVHLTDFLFRRLGTAWSGPIEPADLSSAAADLGRQLGWDTARQEAEVAEFRSEWQEFRGPGTQRRKSRRSGLTTAARRSCDGPEATMIRTNDGPPQAASLQVGMVGSGRMAGILLRAASRFAPWCALRISGRNPGSCDDLLRQVPSLTILPSDELARLSDLVILAVPPEAYREVLSPMADWLAPDAIVVSLTNGVALSSLAELCSNPIVKVIPSVAHEVGRGVALVMAGPRAGAAEIARTTRLFGAFSRPVVVEDRDSRVASNIAGSFVALGAALTEMFVDANASRAVAIDRDELLGMAAETLAAIAALTGEGRSFADIVYDTATPGGTTEAALEVLLAGFPGIATAIVEATFRRQSVMQAGVPPFRDR